MRPSVEDNGAEKHMGSYRGKRNYEIMGNWETNHFKRNNRLSVNNECQCDV